MQPVEEQGYVIVAVNSDTVDYVACAARLACSIKHFHPTASVCLITDKGSDDSCYDHVRLLVPNVNNAYANDSQIFKLTPYRETIKLEADMLIVSEIDHWWSLLRHRDVVISTGCRNWKDRNSESKFYRKCFVENDLPDVYNAITYWRRSALAKEFFDCVSSIFNNWHIYRRLIKFADEVPSTDLVYAMAAQIIGPELCTMPWADYPRITHMKQHHAKIHGQDWTQELVWELDPVRIQTVAQWGAFHYHVKDWQP